MKNKAIFLDRDGTINVDKGYVYKIEDFEFISGVKETIKKLHDLGFLIIIITNQSGIGKEYFSLNDLEKLHKYIKEEMLKLNVKINFYFCPHVQEDNCICRKPKPGMILKAAKDFNIDLSQSYMIGDKLSDVIAGENAGCKTLFVSSWRKKNNIKNLNEATNYIIKKERS